MVNPKVLITAGCSFSTIYREETTWPVHLSEILKPVKEIHLGQGALSNGIISRRIIYNVTKELQTNLPEDILVCIMWSSADRNEMYSNTPIPHQSLNSGPAHHNPVSVAGEKDFYLFNSHFNDEYSELFFKNYYNDYQATIQTLEHILRIEWFLKLHKIKYFMTLFSWQSLPLKNEVQELEIINHPDIKYLYELIDQNNFLPINNMSDYLIQTGRYPNYGFPGTNIHPDTEQHKFFTDNVIFPHLKSKGYID